MFTGFTGETVDFMWGIRFNNERDWFEAHKQIYLAQKGGPVNHPAATSPVGNADWTSTVWNLM